MKRVSRKIGKEPKRISLELSNKNLIIRAVIAGVCLFLGVVLFLNSCSNYLNRSTYLSITYPEFENSEGDKEILFNDEVSIKYYYDKEIEKTGTSVVHKKIDEILENKMIDLHKMCDNDDLYLYNEAPIHNLKYINDNPNEWISINTSLYNLIKTATEINVKTNGKYSIFAGKLYDEWDGIFLFANINGYEEYDPLFNENKRTSLNNIVKSINSETTYFEFNDETKSVKYNVSEEDKSNVTLSLGFLEYAYYLDNLKKEFNSVDLNSGYIQNAGNMVVTLGQNYNTGLYSFESKSFNSLLNNSTVQLDYSFNFNGSINYITFNPMLNAKCNTINDNYYFIKNNNIYYRSMIIDATTGDSYSNNYSTFTFSSYKTLIEQFADNYNLYFGSSIANKEYLLNYEDDEKYGLIVTYNDDEYNIPLNGTKGNTTLLYSKLVSNYFKENYIPYIKVSTYVKNKIVATKGE